MTDSLIHAGHTIDKPSQRVLAHLEQAETGVSTSSELRDAAGIEHAQSITYRINQHLEPAGLVDWVEEDAPGAAGTRRLYRLTSEGREWVAEHRHDLVRPTGLDETANAAQEARETAQKALDEAESAKNSVQSYRQKVARLKTRVTGREDPDYDGFWDEKGHEQRIDDLEDQQATLTQRVNDKANAQQAADADLRSQSNTDRLDDLDDALDQLDQRIDESASRDAEQDDRLDAIESEQEALRGRIDDLDDRMTQMERWAHEQAQRSVWDALLPWR